MDLQLASRVAVVTGGSRGIGYAVAERFRREGAHVVLCGRSQGRLDAAEGMLKDVAGAGAIEAVVADVGRRADLERLVTSAHVRFGRIDVLVNNAGEAPRGNGAETEEGWRQHFEQYVLSVVNTCQIVAPYMERGGGGAIVNVSSVAGAAPASASALAATKAAVNNYTQGLARELASRGVTVNAVLPGLIDGERLHAKGGVAERLGRAFKLEPGAALERWVAENIPRGRLTAPREVADLIVFLCAPCSSAITGALVPIDGGVGRSLLPPSVPADGGAI